jgi:hypothetical protein
MVDSSCKLGGVSGACHMSGRFDAVALVARRTLLAQTAHIARLALLTQTAQERMELLVQRLDRTGVANRGRPLDPATLEQVQHAGLVVKLFHDRVVQLRFAPEVILDQVPDQIALDTRPIGSSLTQKSVEGEKKIEHESLVGDLRLSVERSVKLPQMKGEGDDRDDHRRRARHQDNLYQSHACHGAPD